MKIAVLSDIHGNRHAFEEVMAAVRAESPEEIWCLGDVVGYGADPEACIDMAGEIFDVCLAGNHDLAVRGDLSLDVFSEGAAIAAQWTSDILDAQRMDWLRALEPLDLERDVALYHASPRDPVWEYVLSPLQAEMCLDAQKRRVALIGHSHVALSFCRQPGDTASGETRADGTVLDLTEGEWLVNPGSVGQPRDGDPRAAWILLDTGEWRVEYHRTEYDIRAAAAAIRRANLPKNLAERLRYGQ